MNIFQSIITMLFLSLLMTTVYAKPLYNRDAVTRFEQTNRCSNCDLSRAQLKLNHSGAVLDGANLSGIIEWGFPGINLSEANLQNANLAGALLPHANFVNADVTGARFDGANLANANFFQAIGLNLNHAAVTCGIILPDGKQTSSCKA